MTEHNFTQEMKDIFAKYPVVEKTIPKPVTKIGKELLHAIKIAIEKPNEIWYNIHVRKTNGTLDKPVMWNLLAHDTGHSKKDRIRGADWHVNHFFKASEAVNPNTDETECTYYEKVRQDGYNSGLYDNEGPIIKETDSDN